jgi:hypothetical protein
VQADDTANLMKRLFLLLCVIPLFPGSAADPPLSTGAWTLVHIPDTQNYVASASYAVYATQQMQWITGAGAGAEHPVCAARGRPRE